MRKLIEITQLKTKDTISYSMKHEMQSNKTRQSLENIINKLHNKLNLYFNKNNEKKKIKKWNG